MSAVGSGGPAACTTSATSPWASRNRNRQKSAAEQSTVLAGGIGTLAGWQPGGVPDLRRASAHTAALGQHHLRRLPRRAGEPREASLNDSSRPLNAPGSTTRR